MRVPNPFQTDPVFAKASQNLAQIIRGNPAQEAQLEASLTDARAQQQQSRFQRENREFFGNAADAVGEDPIAVLRNLTRTGNPQAIGQGADLNLSAEGAFQAQNLDPSNAQGRLLALQGGAGLQPDDGTAFTQEAQRNISSRDASEARALELTKARAAQQFPTDPKGLATLDALNGELSTEDAIRLNNPLTQSQALGQAFQDLRNQGDSVPEATLKTNAENVDPTNVVAGQSLDGERTAEDAFTIANPPNTGGSGGSAGDTFEDQAGRAKDRAAIEDQIVDAVIPQLKADSRIPTKATRDGVVIDTSKTDGVIPDITTRATKLALQNELAPEEAVRLAIKQAQFDTDRKVTGGFFNRREEIVNTGVSFPPLNNSNSGQGTVAGQAEARQTGQQQDPLPGLGAKDEVVLTGIQLTENGETKNGKLVDPDGNPVRAEQVRDTIDQNDDVNTIQDVVQFLESVGGGLVIQGSDSGEQLSDALGGSDLRGRQGSSGVAPTVPQEI